MRSSRTTLLVALMLAAGSLGSPPAAVARPPWVPYPWPTPRPTPSASPSASPSPTPATGPVVSAISATDVTDTTATIRWHVSEPATGQTEYGPTTAYGQRSTLESSFAYVDHVQALSALTPGTLYHYRVISIDADGNASISGDRTFQTQGAAPPVPTPTPVLTPSPTPTSAPNPTPVPPAGAYPPERTGLVEVATPFVARPAVGQTIVDPVWGTRITRLTSDGRRHAYARQQPWSADGSLLWLPYGNIIVDAQGQTVRAGLVSDHQWANTERDVCYGGEGTSNVLKKMDCRTGAQLWRTVLNGYSACRSGNGEGRISDDDRYLALQCAGNVVLVVDLRLQAAIVGRRTLAYAPNNVSMSQSGRYVLLNGIGNGVHAWDWAADTTRVLSSWGQHGDVCQDAAGDDWYVQAGARVDAWRMRDGASRALLAVDSVFSESHVSCTNIDRDGWAYLSQYTGSPGMGRDQVVAIRLDGSGIVQVFAHAHHTTGSAYEQQPQAAPDRDGTQVAFASEWGGSSYALYVARP